MARITIWCLAALVMALGAVGCGGDDGASGGGGDCARICGSSCVAEFLPAQSGDDCVRACEMDTGILSGCLSETVSVLACLETIDCGRSGSTACLDQSLAFSDCISP
ncbi:MAG: hypothetical protein OEM15_01115 [Myxococcales bacterium]|nr:hypothetical protein [Myxococcales bacterium]MDH3483759.1 hypothetical protein [Myxococcales bacterium]